MFTKVRAAQKTLDEVIIATDDQRIYDAVTRFGGNVEMTGECATGTERVAVVAERLTCDIVANIQGDEPLLEPAQIDLMLASLSLTDRRCKFAR